MPRQLVDISVPLQNDVPADPLDVHHLEQLPTTGFMVSCFPVKIERAWAGWTRAVAIIDT